MAFLKVDIKPELLRWARETIGENIGNVADKLKTETSLIKSWEEDGKEIPLGALERLARIYKRPLATFFLSEKPKEKLIPKDFRTLPQNRKTPLSKATRLAIRKAWRFQSLVLDLANVAREEPRRHTQEVGSKGPEDLAEKIRDYLKISVKNQFAWKEDRVALTEWIKAVERTGVLVFQISMPIDEVRGFSLGDVDHPIIVLNMKDSVRARIFTLFHEYCHLLNNNAGICDLGDEKYVSGEIQSAEKFCNCFAGMFLVPKKYLLSHPLVKKFSESKEDFNKIVRLVSNDFRVSREVVLRRLLVLGEIPYDFYILKIQEFNQEFKKIKVRSKGGWLVPYRKSLQERGASFISMVFEAKKLGKITTRDITDYLGIHRKHIFKLEKAVREKF